MPHVTQIGRVLVPVADQDETIAMSSSDPRADHAELEGLGVDVDGVVFGGDGTVPLLFFFRDIDKNQLMVVEAPG